MILFRKLNPITLPEVLYFEHPISVILQHIIPNVRSNQMSRGEFYRKLSRLMVSRRHICRVC